MSEFYDKIGVFIEESKNRFIALVNVDGEIKECYVQSSCRLSNFYDLRNKKVFLNKITNPKRTEYIIIAFSKCKSVIFLSPKIANDIFYNALINKGLANYGRRKNIKKEFLIENYKSDFYIEDSNTVIEIKAILTNDKIANFPSVYSERAIEQLSKIDALCTRGLKCRYVLISLTPFIKGIDIQKNLPLGGKLLEMNMKGLEIESYKLSKNKDKFSLKRIPLKFT